MHKFDVTVVPPGSRTNSLLSTVFLCLGNGQLQSPSMRARVQSSDFFPSIAYRLECCLPPERLVLLAEVVTLNECLDMLPYPLSMVDLLDAAADDSVTACGSAQKCATYEAGRGRPLPLLVATTMLKGLRQAELDAVLASECMLNACRQAGAAALETGALVGVLPLRAVGFQVDQGPG